MSEGVVKVLVVDDDERARDRLIEHLRFKDVQVVGESTLGAAAYTWAEQLEVDVVVVSIQEPVARALRTVESLTVGSHAWPVVGVSSLGDRETMRKSMVAGVRDYLVAPIVGEELRRTILNVHQVDSTRRAALAQGAPATRLGTIVTVFGVKGGIGKSTVASNVAVALAEGTKQHVAMVDLDLQFGDAAVMLDVVPTRTIADAAKELNQENPQQIGAYLTNHPSRLKLLAAPPTPEGADQIAPEQVGQALEALASTHDYVVVDTSAQIDPITALALDLSTIVLLVVVPEVPCIRRTKAALALMEESGYSRDKVKLVVNRVDRKSEVSVAEIEKVLQYPIYAQIPDDRAVAKAITAGVPIAMSGPKTKAGGELIGLGRLLAGMPAPSARRAGFFRRFRPAARATGAASVPAVQPAAAPDLMEVWAPAIATVPAVVPPAGPEEHRPVDREPSPRGTVLELKQRTDRSARDEYATTEAMSQSAEGTPLVPRRTGSVA